MTPRISPSFEGGRADSKPPPPPMTLETPPPIMGATPPPPRAGLAVPTAFIAVIGFAIVPQPPPETALAIPPIMGAGGGITCSLITPIPPVNPPRFLPAIISIAICCSLPERVNVAYVFAD